MWTSQRPAVGSSDWLDPPAISKHPYNKPGLAGGSKQSNKRLHDKERKAINDVSWIEVLHTREIVGKSSGNKSHQQSPDTRDDQDQAKWQCGANVGERP